MRAEEVHQLLVYREQRRLEVLRQTRELLSMRLAEQQQRRTQRDIEARLRLEALRESQRQRREEAAELIAMRREEEYLRYVHAEMRRQAAILQQRLRAEEARLQVRERERMMCVGGDGSCVCVLSSCRHVFCGTVCVCVSVCLCLCACGGCIGTGLRKPTSAGSLVSSVACCWRASSSGVQRSSGVKPCPATPWTSPTCSVHSFASTGSRSPRKPRHGRWRAFACKRRMRTCMQGCRIALSVRLTHAACLGVVDMSQPEPGVQHCGNGCRSHHHSSPRRAPRPRHPAARGVRPGAHHPTRSCV